MEDSPNQGGVYAAAAILIVVPSVAVALRLYVRVSKQHTLGLDDYTICGALAAVWALAIIYIYGASQNALGTHSGLNPKTGKLAVTWSADQASLLDWISFLIGVIAYGAIKSSFILLYRRIFVGKAFDIVSRIVLTIIVLWSVSFFFAVLFQCGHNFSAWTGTSAELGRYCIDYKPIWLGHAVSDVATDLIVLLIPIPIILRLQLQLSTRLLLIGIFLLGLLSTAAAVTRLVIITTDLYETTLGFRDIQGVITNVMTWGLVEAAVGVVAACLVTLKPLLHGRFIESIVNSVRSALSLSSTHSPRPAPEESHQNQTKSSGADSYELTDWNANQGSSHNVTTHIDSTTRRSSQEVQTDGITARYEVEIGEELQTRSTEEPPRQTAV